MDVAFHKNFFHYSLGKWDPFQNHTDHISISLYDFLILKFLYNLYVFKHAVLILISWFSIPLCTRTSLGMPCPGKIVSVYLYHTFE